LEKNKKKETKEKGKWEKKKILTEPGRKWERGGNEEGGRGGRA